MGHGGIVGCRRTRASRRAGVLATLALTATLAACAGSPRHEPDIAIGRVSRATAVPAPVATLATADERAAATARPSSASASTRLKGADGNPYGGALVFRSDVPVPAELVFVLVVGSDARVGQDVLRSNADSVHLLAVDPRTLDGTVVGFPRDAWVDIPGRGRGKLTSALGMGGPQLLAATVRHLTGLPVHYYAITGFHGFQRIVDELGGVDVHVKRRMNDRYSGARFAPGWHHFNGGQALAYTRNRRDVPDGDFSRSEHQGQVMLAALAKMRAEVGDDLGIARWIDVLRRHATVDLSLADLRTLGSLARRLDPAVIENIVVPGRVGDARGASVVYLGEDAARLFLDLRDDAVVGSSAIPPSTATSSTSSTTTSTSPDTTTTTTADVPAP